MKYKNTSMQVLRVIILIDLKLCLPNENDFVVTTIVRESSPDLLFLRCRLRLFTLIPSAVLLASTRGS